MNRNTPFFCVLLIASAAAVQAGPVQVIKFEQFRTMTERVSDTTYVFNFFATWCDPCKHEFPAFQKWAAQNTGKKCVLSFISLDFKKDLKRSLAPWLEKQHVENDVFLLDEPDYNSWISRIDSTWSGSLPMTLVVNHEAGIWNVYPQEFDLKMLQQVISPLIP